MSGFNQNTFRLLGKPLAVYLFFSRLKDTIAIEPLDNSRLPEAFPVKHKSTTGWRIQAGPFCKHFGIRIDNTQKFISPDIRDGKLHLKLSDRLRTKLKK